MDTFSGATTASYTRDDWGEHRATVEDQLAACADYLSRLQRSLAGEIAPDRHYFNEKAAHLLGAARRLVELGQDIERWSGECRATMQVEDHDGTYETTCTLPAEHTGDHSEPAETLGERLKASARHVAHRAQRLSDRISWLTTDTDRDVQLGRIAEPDDRKSLAEVEGETRGLGADAARLAAGISVLRRQAGTLNTGPTEATFDRLYRISQHQGPGLTL